MIDRRDVIISLAGAALFAVVPGPAPAQEVLGQGTFTGQSGHETSGSVSVVRTQNGVEVRLGPDFRLDGAPGPWLGFGRGGKWDPASRFSKLNSHSGEQVYKVPDRLDVSKYNEFYVWCRPFNVPLGVAKLK